MRFRDKLRKLERDVAEGYGVGLRPTSGTFIRNTKRGVRVCAATAAYLAHHEELPRGVQAPSTTIFEWVRDHYLFSQQECWSFVDGYDDNRQLTYSASRGCRQMYDLGKKLREKFISRKRQPAK